MIWNSSYNIISQTSSLMKMINENESPELNQKLGEAYYMRGMMYFYLCRVFGRPYYQEPEKNLGVPIVNGMPEDMDNLDLPDRSSVKDTYEQVLSDLKKAEELMSDFKSPAYASKYAAGQGFPNSGIRFNYLIIVNEVNEKVINSLY